jgi:hypothetical protein
VLTFRDVTTQPILTKGAGVPFIMVMIPLALLLVVAYMAMSMTSVECIKLMDGPTITIVVI